MDGAQVAAGSGFVSHLLTPTLYPIERVPSWLPTTLADKSIAIVSDGSTLSGSFSMTVPVPPEIPAGTYALLMDVLVPPELQVVTHEVGKLFPGGALHHPMLAKGGIVTIGSPQTPKLAPALLVDSPSQGQRGVIANEDRGRYDLANRNVMQSTRFVIAPRDLGTGDLIAYRLEPFFPLVSVADRDLPEVPPFQLDLPGGSLTIALITPAGEQRNLGTHPILQVRTGHATTSMGRQVNDGGTIPAACFN